MMKTNYILFFLFSLLMLFSSCGVVETVFKAGMWWAFFLVGLVIVVVLMIVSKSKK